MFTNYAKKQYEMGRALWVLSIWRWVHRPQTYLGSFWSWWMFLWVRFCWWEMKKWRISPSFVYLSIKF